MTDSENNNIYVQMNVSVAPKDVRMVDFMANEDGFDSRSAFVRRLIRQEWARRYSQPNPAVTVEQAVTANNAVIK